MKYDSVRENSRAPFHGRSTPSIEIYYDFARVLQHALNEQMMSLFLHQDRPAAPYSCSAATTDGVPDPAQAASTIEWILSKRKLVQLLTPKYEAMHKTAKSTLLMCLTNLALSHFRQSTSYSNRSHRTHTSTANISRPQQGGRKLSNSMRAWAAGTSLWARFGHTQGSCTCVVVACARSSHLFVWGEVLYRPKACGGG